MPPRGPLQGGTFHASKLGKPPILLEARGPIRGLELCCSPLIRTQQDKSSVHWYILGIVLHIRAVTAVPLPGKRKETPLRGTMLSLRRYNFCPLHQRMVMFLHSGTSRYMGNAQVGSCCGVSSSGKLQTICCSVRACQNPSRTTHWKPSITSCSFVDRALSVRGHERTTQPIRISAAPGLDCPHQFGRSRI